jgi:uncharacterized protein YbaR (Trm112 family)
MSESRLTKEFSKREVQRMRNLITGKLGESTQIQAGWEKQREDREEGEVWEENGKQWTLKNGIKQSVTKMDDLKKLIVLPLCCPNCKKPMKVNEANKKMYSIHGQCLDCTVEMETQLKIAGKWEEYEKAFMDNNHKTYISDLEEAIDSWYKESESHITEDGTVETWTGGSKTKVYEELKDKISEVKRDQ